MWFKWFYLQSLNTCEVDQVGRIGCRIWLNSSLIWCYWQEWWIKLPLGNRAFREERITLRLKAGTGESECHLTLGFYSRLTLKTQHHLAAHSFTGHLFIIYCSLAHIQPFLVQMHSTELHFWRSVFPTLLTANHRKKCIFYFNSVHIYSWPLNKVGIRRTNTQCSQKYAYNIWLPWNTGSHCWPGCLTNNIKSRLTLIAYGI